MAGASLLALLDDIAAVLDDVALMTKVAAKKTAGVLGDDLALNAQQLSGVKADRELPVVWSVAKGSFLNKCIIVPIALALSAFLPVAVTVLLMIGGLYLCYEGFEKVFHKLLPQDKSSTSNKTAAHLEANANSAIDLISFEKEKIKGAIRTDFILSAEIIVIALGTVTNAPFLNQVLVVISLAIALTIGVYGFVAAIVKIDDLGLYLLEKSKVNSNKVLACLGRGLLIFAPFLMKVLVIVGTAAMFLVGGGIILHGIPMLVEYGHHLDAAVANIASFGQWLALITPMLLAGLIGIISGGLCLVGVSLFSACFSKSK
ncbi:MAG: DUF808 domain-containing protein [Thalassotalea sp.]